MIKVYLSHRISGDCKDPLDAQKRNCAEAQSVGSKLRRELNRYAATDVYIPGGATERFVSRAYQKGYLTIAQILEIDCGIIDDCDIVLCYVPKGDELQGGREVEIEHAEKTDKPYYVFSDVSHAIEFTRALFDDGFSCDLLDEQEVGQ